MDKLTLLFNEFKSFLSTGKATEQQFETFVAQFREKVKTIPDKVTAFVKTITLQLPTSNLKKFFVTSDKLWVDDSNFQAFLTDAFSDGVDSPEEQVIYHWHQNIKAAHDNLIALSIGEKIINLGSPEGLIEARRRLNVIKTDIKAQPKGKDGNLLNNAYGNIIGRFRLKNKRVITVHCHWDSVRQLWRCRGFVPRDWAGAGRQFLSCNGETQSL